MKIIAEHSSLKLYLEKDKSERKDGNIYLSEEHFNILKDKVLVSFADRPVLSIKDKETKLVVHSDYYIGVDWLVPDKHSILVEPKLNKAYTAYFNKLTEEDEDHAEDKVPTELSEDIINKSEIKELDYLKMLLELMSTEKTAKDLKNILYIDWDSPKISIAKDRDFLTPFLVIQFLQLTKAIVKKGLKKSYYKVQRNLRNRVKGKILVSAQIKGNIFKNRFGSTYCEYEEFGYNSLENRFLKKVFNFCLAYVENHGNSVFSSNYSKIKNLINYCRPAFEQIGEFNEPIKEFSVRHNPFFAEYKEAIQTGNLILKRFGFSYTKIAEEKTKTPPFWIDMPILFELYFYHLLLKYNRDSHKNIIYQFSTYGNSLDFLITNPAMIMDTKYKPVYNKGRVHEDIRQVSGYARLKKVREKLGVYNTQNLIDCVIVYPLLDDSSITYELQSIHEYLEPINMYEKVYKLGLKLPLK